MGFSKQRFVHGLKDCTKSLKFAVPKIDPDYIYTYYSFQGIADKKQWAQLFNFKKQC